MSGIILGFLNWSTALGTSCSQFHISFNSKIREFLLCYLKGQLGCSEKYFWLLSSMCSMITLGSAIEFNKYLSCVYWMSGSELSATEGMEIDDSCVHSGIYLVILTITFLSTCYWPVTGRC